MKLKVPILSIVVLVLLWASSCRKDFEYSNSNGHISFSRDTVYLDTIFSTIGSSTYSLKVYNETKDDVVIPSIKLRNGEESYYRLNVDGVPGNSFSDIPIYAEDSLFIFIETTVPPLGDDNTELLYVDAIQFDKDVYLQEVELVTLVKDAIFLHPSGSEGKREKYILYTLEDGNDVLVEGFELKDNQLHFQNTKPYVVYGYAAVPEGKHLVIDPGTRVHFHNESGLLVKAGGSIQINGNLSTDQELLEGEVVFEGDRLEPYFSDISGQWGSLWLSKGSINNSINHLTIKNADIGLFVEGDMNIQEFTLEIRNSQIHNSSTYNLWAKSSIIKGENLVLGSSGNSSLYCNLGGSYDFTHITIANYWTNGFRTGRALRIDNHSLTSGNDLIRAHFKNSIIDGNASSELSLSSNGIDGFNFTFENCIIKFKESEIQSSEGAPYNFESTSYKEILVNGFPDYFNPKNNDYRIGLDSDGINQGDLNHANQVPFDILNSDRIPAPDLGAYQAVLKEE